MSYCRFSTDGFQCDAYVYESDAGYITHVASRRRVNPVREIDFTSPETMAATIDSYNADLRDPDTEYKYITLPDAGITFVHDTPAECAENLLRLKRLGYRIPQDAIDELMAEGQEAS